MKRSATMRDAMSTVDKPEQSLVRLHSCASEGRRRAMDLGTRWILLTHTFSDSHSLTLEEMQVLSLLAPRPRLSVSTKYGRYGF